MPFGCVCEGVSNRGLKYEVSNLTNDFIDPKWIQMVNGLLEGRRTVKGGA
jgi:hypothetical protein